MVNNDKPLAHPGSKASLRRSMAHVQKLETAAEYGLRSNCFRDHRHRPFCFEDHVPYIHSTVYETASDGLVAQSGLKVCSIPPPTIDLNTSIEKQGGALDDMCSSPSSPVQPPLSTRWSVIKDVVTPLDELDVGSVPDLDVQEYFNEISSKQFCHIASAWLPLSPAKAEQDEGLTFPSASLKFHSMLERELGQEVVEPSKEDELLKEEYDAGSQYDHGHSLLFEASVGLTRRTYSEVVTPPLSPLSSAASPFIPEGDVTVIDLTSEPSSPVGQETIRIQSIAKALYIDSDIVAPSAGLRSSPLLLGRGGEAAHRAAQDVALEVPIMLPSSDPMGEGDVFADVELPICSDADVLLFQENSNNLYFEDAFESILVSRQLHSANLLEQERLDPSDSISRILVPVLNFELPRPEWLNKGWTSREHLSWLQSNLSESCRLPKVSRDARLESSLKWTPIPGGTGVVSLVEEIVVGTASAEYLTVEGTISPAGSGRYIKMFQQPSIIDINEDEEIEDLEPLNPTSNDALSCDSVSAEDMEHRPTKRRQVSSEKVAHLQEIYHSIRHNAEDYGDTILPRSADASATSTLLAGFMGLRAVKHPRTCHRQDSAAETSAPSFSVAPVPTMNIEPPLLAPEPDLIPAPAPDIDLPKEKGPCIISLTLDRSVVRRLEESWPSDVLLDRDYSQHGTIAYAPGTAVDQNIVSPLIFEADISLPPSMGVIVTTLIKAKQKALPGSKAQTPLRDRVDKISYKYEALVILVSESNPAGEFVGSLSASDMAAYADFVRFTSSLEGDVKTYLVPGGNKTLSKWILSIMSRHSMPSAAIARSISAQDSTWELFLRQAGMNVVAAQILSKTLYEEFGNAGLAEFLVMTPQIRISKYGQLLGGQKVLLRCCERLDRQWT